MKTLIASCLLIFVTACKSPDAKVEEISTDQRQINAEPNQPKLPSASSNTNTGEFVTTFGEHRFGDTIVEADEKERKLAVKHLAYKEHEGGKSSFTSAVSPPPDEWPLHDGWFAYVQQNGEVVWLHNGAGGLLMVERKVTGTRDFTHIYGTNSLPVAIPDVVFSQLSEPLRSRLNAKASE
jgi:hypothetical protein